MKGRNMKTLLTVTIGILVMLSSVLKADEQEYPLTVRVVQVFGSSGPFTCCETVSIRIGTQDFTLVNGLAPHHLEHHGFMDHGGKCLTHVKMGDILHVQGPNAEGKGGRSGPVNADGRYMYFNVLNSEGKSCKAAVLGIAESSSPQNHEQ
jgi:hypothetical protein